MTPFPTSMLQERKPSIRDVGRRREGAPSPRSTLERVRWQRSAVPGHLQKLAATTSAVRSASAEMVMTGWKPIEVGITEPSATNSPG